MTLKDKTHLGLALILLLFLLMAGAGIWGNQQLGFLLDTLTAQVLKVQQSSGEARQLVARQFLLTEQLLQGAPVEMAELEQSESQLDKQLERIKSAGILSAAEQQQLTNASDQFSQIRSRLTDSFAKWQQAQQQMQATVDQIVEIGEIVEEQGDAQVEVLVQNPGRQISWQGGLAQKWDAADGGMEANIGFFRQLYFLEQIKTKGPRPELLKELNDSLAFQKEAVDALVSTGLFQVAAPAAYGEIALGKLYQDLCLTHSRNIQLALAALSQMQTLMGQYRQDSLAR